MRLTPSFINWFSTVKFTKRQLNYVADASREVGSGILVGLFVVIFIEGDKMSLANAIFIISIALTTWYTGVIICKKS